MRCFCWLVALLSSIWLETWCRRFLLALHTVLFRSWIRLAEIIKQHQRGAPPPRTPLDACGARPCAAHIFLEQIRMPDAHLAHMHVLYAAHTCPICICHIHICPTETWENVNRPRTPPQRSKSKIEGAPCTVFQDASFVIYRKYIRTPNRRNPKSKTNPKIRFWCCLIVSLNRIYNEYRMTH